MDREGDSFEYHKKGRRPGEKPDTEESAAEGGGSQGAADIGARGTAEGGTYAEDESSS